MVNYSMIITMFIILHPTITYFMAGEVFHTASFRLERIRAMIIFPPTNGLDWTTLVSGAPPCQLGRGNTGCLWRVE